MDVWFEWVEGDIILYQMYCFKSFAYVNNTEVEGNVLYNVFYVVNKYM